MNLTMNTLLQSLASDNWARVVQALFHTLWVGALLALVLGLVLRRTTNPFVRYRACVAALTGVLFGGLVAWAWLEIGPAPLSETAGSASHVSRFTVHAPPSAAPLSQTADSLNQVSRFTFHASPSAGQPAGLRAFGNRCRSWLPWLALGWLLGTAFMLARSVASVVGAERLRASAAPLEDEGVQRLVQAARRRLAMTRQVRLAVTEKLASPAVVGVVVPTLILPLTLLTTIPANQLQLILLHELAHVRRGDYLANLFQFVIESVLFFNPAVWWLSRQMRVEREACCNALAAGPAQDRLEYARALACVAEQALGSAPAAAPAFADRRHPSALRDRLQRLLVPGYRPALRLTWKALLASLFLGGALLLLSALGTRWTIKAAAQLLSPQQRIERIENAMKKMGEPPADFTGENDLHIPATVVLRTPDGSALPRGAHGAFISLWPRHSAVIGVTPDENGVCRASVSKGTLFFYAIGAEGFAPAYLGPIATRASNEVENIELILQPGFPVSIKAIDADSGQPLADATLNCQFSFPDAGQNLGAPLPVEADEQGIARLVHSVSLPLGVTVIKPGYEMVEERFDPPKSNALLTVSARRALPLAGRLTDATGGPVPEAGLYILRADNAPGLYGSSPDHPGHPLTVTDAQGRYLLNQLPRSGWFWLLIRAEGHPDAILSECTRARPTSRPPWDPNCGSAGASPATWTRCRAATRGPDSSVAMSTRAGNNSHRTSKSVPVRIEGDTGYFEFVSPVAGLVTLERRRPGLQARGQRPGQGLGHQFVAGNQPAPGPDCYLALRTSLESPSPRHGLRPPAHSRAEHGRVQGNGDSRRRGFLRGARGARLLL